MGACGSSPSEIDEEEMIAAHLEGKRLSSYGGIVLRNQLGEDGKAVAVESVYDVRA